MARAERREGHTAEDNVPGIGSGTLTPDAFNQMITDSSSFSLTLDSGTRNAIQWIAAKDSILIGTTGGEWSLSGHTRDKPITPTSYNLRDHTTNGSKDLQPILLTDGFAFINYVGRKLFKMDYDGIDEDYTANELSILAEHITDSGIVDMAFQRNPDPILWLVRDDGVLLSMTYDPKQDVVAWARHPLEIGEGQTDPAELTGVVSTTYGDYAQYFVGIYTPVASTKCVANATVENALDTDWGTDGYWNASTPGASCFSAYQLSDGRILVAHTSNRVTMINTDGTTDTTWGTDGYYTTSAPVIQPRKILEDSDGNFHIFGGTGGSSYTYSKLDSDGTFITGLKNLRLDTFYDVIWADSAKTRIIAVGANTVISGLVPNMMAIEPSEGVVDTSWPGNLGLAGYARWEWGGISLTCYECKLLSDGGFVVRFNNADCSFAKFKFDGTGLDTTWGDAGVLALGTTAIDADSQRMVETDDELYVLVEDASFYTLMAHIDAGGVVVDSNTYVAAQGTYLTIEMINDKLFFGTTSASTSSYNIEQWSTSFVYESGFDIAGVNNISFIFPDEVTRASTDTLWTDTTEGGAEAGANSVCVIPGSTEDEVWITVARKINDSQVRYIERMKPRSWGDDMEDMFFVDSGLTYDGDATTSITGLDHLEGETVAILGDGAVQPSKTVSSGAITLSETASVVQVGLPYTYKLKPMRMDQNIRGTSKGSIGKITEAVISFYKTLNARYGDGIDTLDINWRETDAEYTTPPDLVTGDKLVVADGGFKAEDPFQIEGSDPMPCSVRAIIPRIETTGR